MRSQPLATRALALAAALIVATGCSPAGQQWFVAGDTVADGCAGSDEVATLDRTIGVALVSGAGVTDDDVAFVTGLLATYYGRYGVRFEVAGGPAPIAVDRLISATEADVAAAVDGLPPDSAQARSAIAAELYRQVRSILSTRVDSDVLRLVILRDLNSESVSASVIGEATGIGLSPETVEAQGDPYLSVALGGTDFTPTVFLAIDSLRDLPRSAAMIASAHEVGHASGLGHEPDPSNLMSSDPAPCLPGLTTSQLDHLRQSVLYRAPRP